MKRILTALLFGAALCQAQQPAKDEVLQALNKAATFFHDNLSMHGGYVYAFSGDLQKREGEGVTDAHTIWVQPPGTPLVGEALLDVYAATRDAKVLGYAKEAALALTQRQLHSGGWYYSAHFEGKESENKFYCFDLAWNPQPNPVPEKAMQQPGGWDLWRFARPTDWPFSPDLWTYEHLVKMLSAYGAVLSAFSGNFLTFLPTPWSQLWPTLLFQPLAIIWVTVLARRRPLARA